ncbi:hypothetical protein JTE90_023623 [Oedothorax gibbosus]|uniref:Uncharacterized protein n=1 Tax=Oedothorax gibbosus TaxID=931172 RepID=A0AAV6U682_9ARAC|nr:hypothetical protein JTE90_023623 [Oedothorax gibbosus]
MTIRGRNPGNRKKIKTTSILKNYYLPPQQRTMIMANNPLKLANKKSLDSWDICLFSNEDRNVAPKLRNRFHPVLIPIKDMERSIPHIRSIFTNTSSRKKSTGDTQDLCQYDKSPRSKRKSKEPPVDYYNKHDLVMTKASSTKMTSSPKNDLLMTKTSLTSAKTTNSPKKSVAGKENHHLITEELPTTRKSSSRNGNYNTYTSKTLTEKDMRHLERHLSMKKTIRKQISRNLAQAFLENPDIFEPEDYKQDGHKNDHRIPKDKNPEQNVLDLLKISIEDSRDSGHSSPTHETSNDTDEEDLEESRGWRAASMKNRDSETKGLVDERSKPFGHEPEKKSSSIWKMFSSRNKSKR